MSTNDLLGDPSLLPPSIQVDSSVNTRSGTPQVHQHAPFLSSRTIPAQVSTVSVDLHSDTPPGGITTGPLKVCRTN